MRRCILMYAVIETGGKQYKVQEGEEIRVEKLDVEEGNEYKFDKVMLISKDGDLKIGKPYLEGAAVNATVVKHDKEKKIIVFKYKPKKDYKKKQGHRQPYTQIKIEKIEG
jgi:large subunit ribosomal protein L21